jgi:glycosyltransferase involved in cell wall biosynthesis
MLQQDEAGCCNDSFSVQGAVGRAESMNQSDPIDEMVEQGMLLDELTSTGATLMPLCDSCSQDLLEMNNDDLQVEIGNDDVDCEHDGIAVTTNQHHESSLKRVSIVMPARNEEDRIPATLRAYGTYFNALKKDGILDFEIVVVNNGSTDRTVEVVENIMKEFEPGCIRLIQSEAGKGVAITTGFQDALLRPNDLIGFVDADMATAPRYYYELVEKLDSYDGIIASRNMPGAVVTPPRPFLKKWGRKLFFDSLVRLFFGISYYDTQCGAKLFTRKAIETIVPHITVTQWAYDIDLLYLCKKYGFKVREIPTVWHDQAGSKLKIMRAGFRMLSSIFKLRVHHSFLTKHKATVSSDKAVENISDDISDVAGCQLTKEC